MTTVSTWHNWLVSHALPLWSHAGFHNTDGLYHERLTFDATPITVPHRRLMVQARQVATFCQAELDGLFPGGAQALATMERLIKLYYKADGQAGWVFALGPDLTPSDTKRDLYGHAFILFALSWAYKLSKNPQLLHIARQSLQEITDIFSAEHGGFKDSVPSTETRSQNPHMHLLEACLTLFETSQEELFLTQAEALIALATSHFIQADTSCLLEFFTSTWQPKETIGHNQVEPGHQAEWCWLLGEYCRLAPKGRYVEQAQSALTMLYRQLTRNVPDISLPNALNDSGTLLDGGTRIWPQTEMMRLLAQHAPAPWAERHAKLTAMSNLFFTHYAPVSLNGGWFDRLDEHNTLATDHMPASTLYHIYGTGRTILAASA